MTARIFFHVQHLLGIGHLKRAAIIARALRRAGFAVDFVSGGAPVGWLDLAGAAFLQLPQAIAADANFSGLLDEAGKPIDDAWRARRRRILMDAFANSKADLLLVEMYPFGRRAFAFELLPLMEAAKARGIPVAVSLRDVVVARNEPERLRQIVALVREHVNMVLVHGDPALVRLEASFAAAGEIADRLAYTGYVAEVAPGLAQEPEGDEVLVSAGGGAVGAPLLEAALAARSMTQAAALPWRLIAGPNLPQARYDALAARLPSGVTLERFREDYPRLLTRCRLSLSQAGYNTMMDILAAGARAVVVPFAEPGETEQTDRARILAGRGILTLLEAPVSGERLARAIDRALSRPRPAASGIDLGGAAATARLLGSLVGR